MPFGYQLLPGGVGLISSDLMSRPLFLMFEKDITCDWPVFINIAFAMQIWFRLLRKLCHQIVPTGLLGLEAHEQGLDDGV